MRMLSIAIVCAIAVVLGAVQAVASIALRDRAQAPAWVLAVPHTLGARVDHVSLRLPLPSTLRLILARRALDRDDLGDARSATADLPRSRDRLALEAAIDERRGDRVGAVRDYLAAGDLAGVTAAVARLQAAGRSADALALQEEVVARLATDLTQADALAEAYYRLGIAHQARAYAFAVGQPIRGIEERRALDAYERASHLAPLEERYLIALGNQRINVGDLAGARRTFDRARDVDPTSAEPWTGLGDVALKRGDRVAAHAMLVRARAIDPHSDAVRRLATELRG